MRLFLAGTCDDVTRWLPPPQWEPAWQSEAARECGNGETGPSGEWGEHTVRTVYAGAALYLDTILRCIQAMARAGRPMPACPAVFGWLRGCAGDRGRGVVAI
jgi:hypothetical protein